MRSYPLQTSSNPSLCQVEALAWVDFLTQRLERRATLRSSVKTTPSGRKERGLAVERGKQGLWLFPNAKLTLERGSVDWQNALGPVPHSFEQCGKQSMGGKEDGVQPRREIRYFPLLPIAELTLGRGPVSLATGQGPCEITRLTKMTRSGRKGRWDEAEEKGALQCLKIAKLTLGC